jgi:hypothetical protein
MTFSRYFLLHNKEFKETNTTGCKNVVYRLSKTQLPKEQSSEETTIETVLCCDSLTSNKQLQ